MSSLGPPIAVGMPAPSFALGGDAGPPLSSSESRGRPWVLAFVHRWTPETEAASGAIRAQLRGLGAILFIVSDAGVWSFRPDDDIELSARPSPQLAREIDQLAERYGVPAGRDGAFVIDEEGCVRFAHAPSADLTTALAAALAAAGRERLGLARPGQGMTRREWSIMSLVAGFGAILLASCHPREPDRPAAAAPRSAGASELDVVLHINKQARRVRIDARASLLDVLREQLALTGTRKGCDHGQCGACTVLRDGRAVNACLTLAAAVDGSELTTIEGLARGEVLHPLQAAFITHDAFQCGFCTSGQIMAGVSLIHEGRARTDDEVRQQMSGNICRCGAYPNIVAAIQAARKEVVR